MEPHGINTHLSYQILDKNQQELIKEEMPSKLEGYVEFENIKTGKKKTLPFRSFVGKFLEIIYGLITGNGNYGKLWTASTGITTDSPLMFGLMLGTNQYPGTLQDTDLTVLRHASLENGVQTTVSPQVNGYNMNFNLSRLFTNTKAVQTNAYEVGIYVKAVIASAASTASNSGIIHLVSRDVYNVPILAGDSVRVTFTFTADQGSSSGGILLNFVKLIYNTIFFGNLNRTPKIVSRSGANPSYTLNTIDAGVVNPTTGSLAETYVGGAGNYIGIGISTNQSDYTTAITPSVYSFNPTQGTQGSLTAGANIISSIDYTTNSNAAFFDIRRDFSNNTTNSISVYKIGLLTRGNTANITGATLHDDQILLMLNKPVLPIVVAPGQILRTTYRFSIASGTFTS